MTFILLRLIINLMSPNSGYQGYSSIQIQLNRNDGGPTTATKNYTKLINFSHKMAKLIPQWSLKFVEKGWGTHYNIQHNLFDLKLCSPFHAASHWRSQQSIIISTAQISKGC